MGRDNIFWQIRFRDVQFTNKYDIIFSPILLDCCISNVPKPDRVRLTMALLQGRKPLGALDGNKQGISDKRVQPARAAKTSHKWLVQRNSGLDVKQFEYEIAGRCKNLMPGLENKENFGAERYGYVKVTINGTTYKP